MKKRNRRLFLDPWWRMAIILKPLLRSPKLSLPNLPRFIQYRVQTIPLTLVLDYRIYSLSRVLDVEDVRTAIRSLQGSMSMSTDGIPAFVIKDCVGVIPDALLHIFNLVLRHKRFPDCWKLSRVTPIFKSGSKNVVSNYRPLSIISNISKVLELIVCKYIYIHI